MRALLWGLAIVCISPWARAEDRLAAPTGQLGAGIAFNPRQHGRVYGELGFFHRSDTSHLNSVPAVVGFGYKVVPTLELEALLPLAFAEIGSSSRSEAAFGVGNLHVGLSYLRGTPGFRMKLGLAVEYGPWTNDSGADTSVALILGHPVGGGQDIGLWVPGIFSIVAPGRFEVGETLVAGADVALGAHFPVADTALISNADDVVITVQVAPGVGVYLGRSALLGLRMPITLVPTNVDDDGTLLALEPYARFDLGGGFLNARLTMNLDEPYGFSFDEDRLWGLHVGGGATF